MSTVERRVRYIRVLWFFFSKKHQVYLARAKKRYHYAEVKKLPFWSFDIVNWQLCNRNCQMLSVGASFAPLCSSFVNFKGQETMFFLSRLLDRVCYGVPHLSNVVQDPQGVTNFRYVHSSFPNNLKTILPHKRNNWNCSLKKNIFSSLLFASERHFV